MPEVGEPAPEFSLPNGAGEIVRLSDFRGRKVVLYFYPKDLTTGCTQESCDFRDRHDRLTAAGAIVLGVSPDPPKSHVRFAKKHQLPFQLLADTEKTVAMAYGVWQEKSMYGRSYMGVVRSTFLIDENGVLEQIWSPVKINGHAEEVLVAVTG